MNSMSVITRVLTAIAALGVVIANYVPVWKIDLTAPQYPEGLYMTIWTSKLGGDIEIINGLNHYIGMKTLHTDDFAEFAFLPWVIWALATLGIITAFINRKKVLYGYFGLFLVFAIAAMIDFYRWEYNYGHNLDPNAAIQIPGMSYQPPLIGYKQLLNFSAYSVPAIGGWILITCGVLLAGGILIEYYKQRTKNRSTDSTIPGIAPAGIAMLMLLFAGCTIRPEPIRFGKDNCDYCKMIIVDKKFGGEIVTSKGKIYKFDDIKCVVDFINDGKAEERNSTIYFLDYNGTGNFIEKDSAFLMKSESLRSPMSGNTAAFPTTALRDEAIKTLAGTSITWQDLMKQ